LFDLLGYQISQKRLLCNDRLFSAITNKKGLGLFPSPFSNRQMSY
jgi:hypothetical protein